MLTENQLISSIQAAASAEFSRQQPILPCTPTPTPADRGGQILNLRYRLGRRLASGSLGDIYQALDFLEDRPCSLKFVSHSLKDSLHAQRCLENEAAIISTLCHPNIAEGYELTWDEEGDLFLVMEALDGQDLQHLLEQTPMLPLERALEILRATGRALQYAHDLDIIHRDIQPESIFLHLQPGKDEAPAVEVVKLINFGLGKELFPAEKKKLSNPGLGPLPKVTPYMSPEAARGEEVDARSDQWSLAVLAYRMLTGKLPFQHSDPERLEELICESLPDPMDELGPEPPSHVVEAINRALSKDREQRFGSVQDFIRALDGQAPLVQKRTVEVVLQEVIEQCRSDSGLPAAAHSASPIEDQATRQYPALCLPELLLASAQAGPVAPEPIPEPIPAAAKSSTRRLGAGRRLWLAGSLMLGLASTAAGMSLGHLPFFSDSRARPAMATLSTLHPKSALHHEHRPAQRLPKIVQIPSPGVTQAPELAELPRPARLSRARPAAPKAKPPAASVSRVSISAIPQGIDKLLVKAQMEYVDGNYKQAIAMATSAQKYAPTRAWRLIGASACYMGDGPLIQDAYTQLKSDPMAQRFVGYVCKINGLDVNGRRSKTSTSLKGNDYADSAD